MANKLHAHGKAFKLIQQGKVTGFTFSQKRQGSREFDHRAILFTTVPADAVQDWAAHDSTAGFKIKRARRLTPPQGIAENVEELFGAVGSITLWNDAMGALQQLVGAQFTALLGFGFGAPAHTAGDVGRVIERAREELKGAIRAQHAHELTVPDGRTRACLDPGTGRVKFGVAGGTWSVTSVGPMVIPRNPDAAAPNDGADRLDPSTLYVELYDLTHEHPGTSDDQVSEVTEDPDADADAGIVLVCVYGKTQIG